MALHVFHTATTHLLIKSPIDGLLKHLPVTITYAHEEEPWSEDLIDYGNEEDNAKQCRRFERGLDCCIWIKVTASALGEHGYDSLGGCIIKCDNLEPDGIQRQLLELASEHDMKNNACAQLKGNILCSYKLLSEALGCSYTQEVA